MDNVLLTYVGTLTEQVNCVGAEGYRYGYQGSEKDDEVKGESNSYTTEFRMLDLRLGRWLSIDPMSDKYPELSPYISMENNPISLNDPLGDDPPKEQGFFKSAGRWLIGNSYITKAKNFAHENGIDESNIDINRSLKVAVISHLSTDVKVGINEFGADITEFVITDVVTVFKGNRDYAIIDPEVNFDTPVSYEENYKYYTREKTIDDYTADGGFNWDGWETGFALWKGGYGPNLGKNPTSIFRAAKRIKDGLSFGKTLTKKQAISRLRSGRDVYASSRSQAKNVMKNTDTQGKVINEVDKIGSGKYWHFHDKFRKIKGHVFYGKPH